MEPKVNLQQKTDNSLLLGFNFTIIYVRNIQECFDILLSYLILCSIVEQIELSIITYLIVKYLNQYNCKVNTGSDNTKKDIRNVSLAYKKMSLKMSYICVVWEITFFT